MFSKVNRGHFYAVDLIRLVSAILVMLYHYSVLVSQATGAIAFPYLSAFTPVGNVGVEIFFVISGLVISMSAENARGLQGAIHFIRMRALRIFPALWISSLIAFSVLLVAGGDLTTLVESFVKTSTLSPVGPYLDGVVWSLVVEAVFYIVVAITIIAAPLISLDTLSKAICAVSTAYLIAWTCAYFNDQSLFELLSRFPSKVFLLRYGVFFALGMLLWARLCGNRSASTGAATLISAAMCVLEIVTTRDWSLSASAAAASLWISGVVLLVLSIVYSNAIEKRLSGGARKTLRYCGTLSYAVYLNHYTFGQFVIQSLLKASRMPVGLVFVTSVCAVLSMAAFVASAERVVKRPFRMRTTAQT